MPSRLLPASLVLALTLVACPAPPEPPPGPNAGPPGQAFNNGQKGPPGNAPPPGSRQPASQNPSPVGSSTASTNPTGPPVPPSEGPHANEFDPNAGKDSEADPMARDLKIVPPQLTQDTVRAGDHYTVKGSVEGSCDGTIRIDVLEDFDAPPAPGAGPSGPLTATDLSSTGSFSLAVPSGKKVSLSAVCDSDKDGIVSSMEPVSEPGNAEGITGAKSGLTLKLVAPSAG